MSALLCSRSVLLIPTLFRSRLSAHLATAPTSLQLHHVNVFVQSKKSKLRFVSGQWNIATLSLHKSHFAVVITRRCAIYWTQAPVWKTQCNTSPHVRIPVNETETDKQSPPPLRLRKHNARNLLVIFDRDAYNRNECCSERERNKSGPKSECGERSTLARQLQRPTENSKAENKTKSIFPFLPFHL